MNAPLPSVIKLKAIKTTLPTPPPFPSSTSRELEHVLSNPAHNLSSRSVLSSPPTVFMMPTQMLAATHMQANLVRLKERVMLKDNEAARRIDTAAAAVETHGKAKETASRAHVLLARRIAEARASAALLRDVVSACAVVADAGLGPFGGVAGCSETADLQLCVRSFLAAQSALLDALQAFLPQQLPREQQVQDDDDDGGGMHGGAYQMDGVQAVQAVMKCEHVVRAANARLRGLERDRAGARSSHNYHKLGFLWKEAGGAQ